MSLTWEEAKKKLIDGCPKCEFDEASGALINHCFTCLFDVVSTLHWLITHEGYRLVQGKEVVQPGESSITREEFCRLERRLDLFSTRLLLLEDRGEPSRPVKRAKMLRPRKRPYSGGGA
jgi:hypothetical protein